MDIFCVPSEHNIKHTSEVRTYVFRLLYETAVLGSLISSAHEPAALSPWIVFQYGEAQSLLIKESASSMPTVPLPGFAGVSFFSAVVQQQRRASGCLLPVPAIELLATAADKDVEGLDDSCTSSSQLYTSSPHDWVQQVVQLTQDLGFVPQPISTVAAAAPMSKAEKSLNKQSRKGLWQQMQPTAKQANTATGAGAGPALAQFTAQYVSSFSDSATTSSNNKKVDQAAVHMTGLSLMLNEPVIPKANTVWGKEAHVQVWFAQAWPATNPQSHFVA